MKIVLTSGTPLKGSQGFPGVPSAYLEMHHMKAKFFKVTKTKGSFKIPQILIEDIQRNGKISHALGLEEFILLK